MVTNGQQDVVRLYVEHAHEMLTVAQVNLENGFYSSCINRAYYAVFYMASALLYTEGETRSKHSAVVSAFRQRFIKTGRLPIALSRIYGDLMSARQYGDYDLAVRYDAEETAALLDKARHFVEEVEQWLRARHWL